MTTENDDAKEPTIRLDHFLQSCGVGTGGQAKLLIQGGDVLLNGIVETRRRKKLRVGDEVEFLGDAFIVSMEEEEPAVEPDPTPEASLNSEAEPDPENENEE